jgi:hypothetical protein
MIPDEVTIENLRRQNAIQNKAWLAQGKLLSSYICPRCDEEVRICRPDPEQVGKAGYQDMILPCIHCGNMAFVHVYQGGTVIVNFMPQVVRTAIRIGWRARIKK